MLIADGTTVELQEALVGRCTCLSQPLAIAIAPIVNTSCLTTPTATPQRTRPAQSPSVWTFRTVRETPVSSSLVGLAKSTRAEVKLRAGPRGPAKQRRRPVKVSDLDATVCHDDVAARRGSHMTTLLTPT